MHQDEFFCRETWHSYCNLLHSCRENQELWFNSTIWCLTRSSRLCRCDQFFPFHAVTTGWSAAVCFNEFAIQISTIRSAIELHPSLVTQTDIRYVVYPLHFVIPAVDLCCIYTDTSHVDDKEKEYWYGIFLQSVYLCFRSLRVQGLIKVKLDYFFELLNFTSECLNKLHGKSNNQVFIHSWFSMHSSNSYSYSFVYTEIIVAPVTNYVCLSGWLAH